VELASIRSVKRSYSATSLCSLNVKRIKGSMEDEVELASIRSVKRSYSTTGLCFQSDIVVFASNSSVNILIARYAYALYVYT